MKNRRWLLALALLLCGVTMLAAALPDTVAYIADRTNTVRNTFRIEYLPPEDISVPVRVHKTVLCLGTDTIGPEGFTFCLENLDTGAFLPFSTGEDGWATGRLTFTADDVNKTYHYRLREINTGREFVTYDERVYEISITLQLDDRHEMVAVLMMDGAEVDALTAEFENMYQKMEIPDTGDAAQPLLWLALMVLSAAGMLLLRHKDRNLRRML